ncbi:MAG: hypothetical protein AAFN78_19365 [Pseudomonadota bacterium]
MARPQIVEANYYTFKKRLQTAVDKGNRIERTDKEAWSQYIQSNKINDIAMLSWGKLKFAIGKPTLVVIDDDSDWAGFYAYSDEDESCLKWVRPDA